MEQGRRENTGVGGGRRRNINIVGKNSKKRPPVHFQLTHSSGVLEFGSSLPILFLSMLVLSTPCSSGSPRSATVEPIEQPPPIELEFAQWWKCGSCWLLKSYCFACQGRGIHWNGFNVQCVFEDYVILLATTVTGGSELRCFNGFVKNGEEVPCCESETEKAIAQPSPQQLRKNKN